MMIFIGKGKLFKLFVLAVGMDVDVENI
jgi:hypothetical protein